LQGATNSVNSIAQMVGPFSVYADLCLFHQRSGAVKMPGAPFLLAAALLGAGLLIRVADAENEGGLVNGARIRATS